MNDRRRGILDHATRLLLKAAQEVERALDEEQDCLDNMPEGFQGTDRYEKMENAVDKLGEALDGIDDIRDCIIEAMV